MAFNEEDGKMKLGSKGVPASCSLELMQFLSKLYDGSDTFVEFDSLRLFRNQMTRMTTRKVALNDVFTKFHVENDRITCKPIKVDNKYI